LAPEILFNPELIGQEDPGVHQVSFLAPSRRPKADAKKVIVDSINRTDLDLRKSLFSNIVLSGGSTLCTGFGDRLLNEVKKLALKDVKLKIYAPPERKVSSIQIYILSIPNMVLTDSTLLGLEVVSWRD
jgi:centractin